MTLSDCLKKISLQIIPRLCCALWVLAAPAAAQTPLTLERAVMLAHNNDPWLEGSRYREQALLAQSAAAATLPDPVVSLNAANLPVDSFDLGEQPMTQLVVGFSQMFPRGDTRDLESRRLAESSAQQPILRAKRRSKVTLAVSELWLEAYRNRQAYQLIESDRELFEHLVDVAQSSYTSAVGTTRQQDLVRAQLELTQLEDRLTVLQQQQEASLARLREWLPDITLNPSGISDVAPTLKLTQPSLVKPGVINQHELTQLLLRHPEIRVLEQKISVSSTVIDLAQQKYKPQWTLNASYGYRDDDPLGNDRSDFFSLGVSFDVPLFTARRQDREVQAARAEEAAMRTEKALAMRAIRAGFEAAAARLQRLEQRRSLYANRLLQEVHHQAEASLNAYTNDAGDFAEVVRAHIAELNANIDFLNIKIDRLRIIAQLNYFMASVDSGHAGGIAP